MNRWRAVSLAVPLALLLGCPPREPVLPAGNPPPSDLTFRIDSSQSRRFIHATIYGTNAPQWNGHSRWLTLARVGGNRLTAYNWENNASNAGSDWFHQNDDLMGGGNVPGEAMRRPVEAAFAAGAAIVMTVPIAGYVAADKNGGGDVNQTPNYLRRASSARCRARGARSRSRPTRATRSSTRTSS